MSEVEVGATSDTSDKRRVVEKEDEVPIFSLHLLRSAPLNAYLTGLAYNNHCGPVAKSLFEATLKPDYQLLLICLQHLDSFIIKLKGMHVSHETFKEFRI